MKQLTDHVIGIDVGTGGSKAIVLRADDGAIAANGTTPYPLSTPRPLWAEQSPQDWWVATCHSIRSAMAEANLRPEQIAAVGLTGQMHGLVLLDQTGEPLRPAILWNDQRTAVECDQIHERMGEQRMISLTGKPALTGFTAPKILWVRTNEPQVYADTSAIVLPKDFVRLRLTGQHRTDVADASGTSLFDVNQRHWSEDICAALEIPTAWLPSVSESADATASIDDAGAAATGLLQGTPVVAGAGDQAAEAIGCGIVDHGMVSVTIGTSGVVFAATNDVQIDTTGRMHTYCHAVPGMWHVMGVMLSAGGSLRWFRDELWTQQQRSNDEPTPGDQYDAIMHAAATVPAGCEGLMFLPYLTGERTPHPDPLARGAFIGLTLRHTRTHMARAVMEGVTFGLMDALQLAKQMQMNITRIRVSGGGARSPLWRQMMADVFNTQVTTVNVTQGAALGAAILASVGCGLDSDVPGACRRLVRELEICEPGHDGSLYAQCHERYQALYPALKNHFASLTT